MSAAFGQHQGAIRGSPLRIRERPTSFRITQCQEVIPSGRPVSKYKAYLQSYTEHFGFDHDVMLNTCVKTAQYDEAAQFWTVTVDQKRPGESVETKQFEFDRLIVCNGIFSHSVNTRIRRC